MSEAACKTILCSGGARAGILAYMIRHQTDAPLQLRLAANAAVWELETAVEVTHLLVEQKYKITRQDAYSLIHTMDTIEAFFANQNDTGPSVIDAISFLTNGVTLLHNGILALHLAVTGESADYQNQH